ncbi:hypothetical protein BX600DRAFT_545367 [Xylariales sp. PMI_506]|nr:hypothetical protein BX600DRAFT_545367 [Xylariales sp. PMI_506]
MLPAKMIFSNTRNRELTEEGNRTVIEQQVALLEDLNRSEERFDGDESTQAPRTTRTPWAAFFCLQIALLVLYTFVFFWLRQSVHYIHLVYSPASSAVKYEIIRFNTSLIIDSPFVGPPSTTTDAAWAKLVNNTMIAVPKSDLSRIKSTSIPIPDTDDMYFAGLGVFHELHCLKRIRQYIWKEHYFPNLSENDERLNKLHTDHCIEIIRQSIQCHSDTSLFTMHWSEGEPEPQADFTQEHACIDFAAINAWAQERRIDASKPGLLVHPKFGVVYPEGESSKIGATDDVSAQLDNA